MALRLDCSERDRQIGMERAEFLRLVQERVEAFGETEPVAAATVAATEGGRFPILSTAGKKGASALSIYNYRSWRRLLAQSVGLAPEAALVPNFHKGTREGTADAQHPFIQMVAGYYETEAKMALKHAWMVAKKQAQMSRMPKDQVLSYAQVHYYYERTKDRNALMLARMGKSWFEQHRCGYIERDWSDVAPGECWIGDHHVFDAPVRCWSTEKNCWVPMRPWLTAWLDARSLYLIGWIIRAGTDTYPDSQAIADAMLMGIRSAGNVPPVVAYTDNGKDYCARGFAEPFLAKDKRGKITEHSVLASLGCDPRRALPYNARAKTVERMFENVATQFSKWWPGYIGNCPANRPEQGEEIWKKHADDLPSLHQFSEAFALWLQEFYHCEPRDSKITDGRSPQEVWNGRKPQRAPLSNEQLYFAMLHPQGMRVVDRGGRVKIDGRTYQSEDLWKWIGEKVFVKIDRFNSDCVYAFEADGTMLAKCEKVVEVPALAEGKDRDLISKLMADNRRLLAHARAIQQDDQGGMRVVPAAIDRMRLAMPEIMPSQVEEAARQAEIEIAAQGGCRPAAGPVQPDCMDVSDADLEEFQASVGKALTRPAGAPIAEAEEADDLMDFKAALKPPPNPDHLFE